MIALGLIALLATSPVTVASVKDGNALTLPAARHLLRLDPQNGKPAAWLLALQQDGTDGRWLGWWRSDDEGQSWHWYAPIQNTSADRDTADVVAVGMDVALVYSFEGPTLSGSTAHGVWFQWWRWDGNADWVPQPAVKIFTPASSANAYARAEIALDSLGRIWVWAQRLNSDGTFTGVISVSSDGGKTFVAQPGLDSFGTRPGGRIMPIGGNRLMLLYSAQGGQPGYMRIRSDGDALSTWGARQLVFSEGIYHGAALSAAGDGSGGVHLVYKDSAQELHYRHYDGTSWSGSQLVESTADWALQPAVTRIGSTVLIFWNRMIAENTDYHFYYRTLSNGSLGTPQQLDGSTGFKGYPAAAETLPGTVPAVPALYGDTTDASSAGVISAVFAPAPGGITPPPPPPPPPPSGGVLFSDNFNRTSSSDLGPNWTMLAGVWFANGISAQTDRHPLDRAVVAGVSCADCRVDARMVNFASAESMLELRAGSSDRYALALRADGVLEIRRYSGGGVTVLGSVPSGIADLRSFNSFGFVVQGTSPVSLTGYVNGSPKVSATDSSSSALTAAGAAGMAATLAGVLFDDFTLSGAASGGGGSDGGVADGGTGDGGVTDGGVADAGTPDAGTPDAGTPDAGTPDAGTPDAGAPDAGTSGGGVLFSDNFNRTSSSDLGPDWTMPVGVWFANGSSAQTDRHPLDRALVAGISCADCRIDAKMANFASAESMLELRAGSSDRYALALRADGVLEIRRYGGGGVTVLGSVPSGISDLRSFSAFGFVVQGAGPVSLTGYVNGVPKISATDASSSALTSPGAAGMAATLAGVIFDDFVLTGVASGGGGSGSDGGVGDGGVGDGGVDGGGVPDGGTASGDWPFYRHDAAGTSNAGGTMSTAQGTSLKLLFQVSVPASVANPVVANGTLFVAGGNGKLIALDPRTGATRWSRSTGVSTLGTCARYSQGEVGAAAVVSSRVFAPGGDGRVYAFDAATGNQLWSTQIANTANDEFLWSSAIPIGGAVYVGVATLQESTCNTVVPGRLVGLDQASGSVLGTWWSDASHGAGGGIWTSAAFDGSLNRIFVTTGNVDNGVSAATEPWQQAFVAIDPSSLRTADSDQPIQTDFSTDWDFGASPTLFDTSGGRHMVAATNKNGLVYALDRANLAGGVRWTARISDTGDSPDLGVGSIVSPTFANGLLYVGGGATTDGFPGAIAALDPATGATVWKVHPDGFVLPAMAAAGDVLVAGVSHSSGSGRIYVLDQASGATLFSMSTTGKIFAEPTWANGVLYVVDLAGNLYALSP